MPDRLTNEQHVWDCRWASLANERARDRKDAERECAAAWVCCRNGTVRPVTERECASCPFWELDPLIH